MELRPNDKGKVWLSQTSLVDDYKHLAEKFLAELNGLQTFQANVDKAKILKSTVKSLLSILEYYLSQVPSATNVLHPDISLFDHLRITAVISEGLYDWHSNQKNDGHHYDDNQTAKWQLVCGDLSGIQKFIYKISNYSV